ncbi:MAG: hypothetical protein WBE76_10135 [Terracidiphilus sp.]
MFRVFAYACLVAGCLVSASVSSVAQENVHALTGTVSSINSVAKTITVLQDNGSQGVFADLTNAKTRISFDKHIAAETTAADAFDKKGAYAIVFYVGDVGAQSVVALKSLGSGPFSATIGTLEKIDNRDHSISVEDKSGAVQTFKINAQTVAEGAMGVEVGLKFQAEKGDQVRVVSTTVDGAPTALFLREM